MNCIKELIFFVTSRCNMKCQHCFIWQELNKKNDLAIEDIEEVSKAFTNLETLTLSGGEPFLRKDLSKICQLFISNTKLKNINIPTNGFQTESIIKATADLLELDPRINISIRLSLDGLENFHDHNRGCKGSFQQTIKTTAALIKLKEKYSNLAVDITTTLFDGNSKEVIDLYDYIYNNFPCLDHFYWGVLRGSSADASLCPPSLATLQEVDNKLLSKIKKQQPRNYFMNRFYKELFTIRRKALIKEKLPFHCIAGSQIIVLYSNGDLAPCELLPPLGNIKNDSIFNLMNSPDFTKCLKSIANNCNCTHECFLYPSLLEHYKKNKVQFYIKYLPSLICNKLAKLLK